MYLNYLNISRVLATFFTDPDINKTVTGSVDDNSAFGGLIKNIQSLGNGVTAVLMTVVMFVLVVLAIGAAILFAGSAHAEGKTKILYVIGGTMMAFGAVAIIATAAKIGAGLGSQVTSTEKTTNTSTATPGTQ